MRVAAIVRPGVSARQLQVFQKEPSIAWQAGLPANEREVDAVVIFGGDGTVHRYLPELVQLQIPVLVVPHGSGNDFARALGLRTLRDSLAAWRRFASGAGNVRAIDLGVIRPANSESPKHYFCTVAGVGLDGAVLRRANRLPRWLRGNGGYALCLLPVLWRFSALPILISASGEKAAAVSVPTVLAAFANTPTYGGGMKIAPRARIDDGHLDVCLIRHINKLKLMCVFPSVYFGSHLGLREFEYYQAAALKVETETPWDVYADGEYVCQTPIEVGVELAALRVIVPHS